MSPVPSIRLNNGVEMPQLGFGVFQVPDAETTAAVTTALEVGYRSIDTAAIYGNERGVGSAIANSGIARGDLFVTSKVWNSDHGYDATLAAYDASLKRLGLDYLDLFLIHWPAPANNAFIDTWKALEKLYADGRVRAIGVSNFEPDQLQRILDDGSIVPVVNQVELHPALRNRTVEEFNASHDIITEAWSPLAQGAMLKDPAVTAVAAAHDRSPAQVILRWHLQQGRIVIPKSVTRDRVIENFNLFDFELSDTELAGIDALDRDGRTGPHPAEFNG